MGASNFTSYKDGISLNKYIKIYRKNPNLFKNITVKLYWYLRVTCNKNFYNAKKRLGSWKKIDDDLKKSADEKRITLKELKDLSVGASYIGRVLVVDNFTWIKVKEFYHFFQKHHFKIMAKMQDKTFPAGRFKHVFILKKVI